MTSKLEAIRPVRVELGIAALFTVAALWLGWLGLRYGGWVVSAVALFCGAIALGLALSALRSLRFSAAAQGSGLVEVTEARIAYFSADSGAFVGRDALLRVDLQWRETGPFWLLYQSGGPDLAIPHAAEGGAALEPFFESLPGFDMTTALARLEHKPAPSGPLWERGKGA